MDAFGRGLVEVDRGQELRPQLGEPVPHAPG
jgi:hypothetical protein